MRPVDGYGNRYLDHKEFVKLCSNLEIENVTEHWLEYLERNKILFPDLRIKMPLGYAKYVNNEGVDLDYDNNVKKNWQNIHYIFRDIENWNRTGDIFHPIDKGKFNNNYIQIPAKSKFRKWNYRINNEKHDTKIPWQKNYYPYWRAYYVYEITEHCTKKYIINIFDKKVVKPFRKEGFNLKNIYAYQPPYNYENRKRDFLGRSREFNVLAFYVESIERAKLVENWKEFYKKDKEFIDIYESRREHRIACLIKDRFKLNKANCLDFLKFLSFKYFQYKEEKMMVLAQMIRYDIANQMNLVRLAFDITPDDIYREIGRVKGTYINSSLEFILRGEIIKAREYFHKLLLRRVNGSKNMPINIPKEDVNEFMEFCEKHSMESIYFDLYKVENETWNIYNILPKLASLTVSFESFLRIILKVKTSKERYGLLDAFKKMYNKTYWWKDFSDKWSHYNNDDELDIIVSKLQREPLEDIAKTFLIVGMLRNNIAHSAFTIKFNNIDPSFYFGKIAEAFWYVWEYNKKSISN